MIQEVEEAKKYLAKKFKGLAPSGTYAIPTQTSKGKAFMSVTVDDRHYLSGFDLFWDEQLTKSWYDKK